MRRADKALFNKFSLICNKKSLKDYCHLESSRYGIEYCLVRGKLSVITQESRRKLGFKSVSPGCSAALSFMG